MYAISPNHFRILIKRHIASQNVPTSELETQSGKRRSVKGGKGGYKGAKSMFWRLTGLTEERRSTRVNPHHFKKNREAFPESKREYVQFGKLLM